MASPMKMVARTLAPTYFFTLNPKVQAVPVGEIPGGYRVDLRYTNGRAGVDPNKFDATWLNGMRGKKSAAWPPLFGSVVAANGAAAYDLLKDIRQNTDATTLPGKNNQDTLLALRKGLDLEWFGIDGNVKSGSDWATIRDNGVAVFDGRVTIETDDHFVFDTVISGVVDLRDRSTEALADPTSSSIKTAVYANWQSGTLVQPVVPAVLSMRFEAADAAESWAALTLKKASAGFWKYERLVRGQFVAIGEITVGNNPFSPILDIVLDVYEIEAR